MRRACSDGDPEIVTALPHPQSVFFVAVEKHVVRSATDAELLAPLVIVVVAAGEKADAAAAAMRAPTTRFLIASSDRRDVVVLR